MYATDMTQFHLADATSQTRGGPNAWCGWFPRFTIDSGNSLLGGRIEGAFGYLAIVILWDAIFAYRTTIGSTASILTAVPVPEPATTVACAGFAGLLLAHRRRKTATTFAHTGT